MVKIHRLRQPNKHSGTKLEPGKALELRGMQIKNTNEFPVYVDTFQRKPWTPAKKGVSKSTKKKAA